MKRLILAPILLTLLLASCSNSRKYNSIREAKTACNDWVKEGGTFNAINRKVLKNDLVSQPEETYKIPIRWCKEEKDTKQILGLRVSKMEDGNVVGRKRDENAFYLKRCEYGCDQLKDWSKQNSQVEENFYY